MRYDLFSCVSNGHGVLYGMILETKQILTFRMAGAILFETVPATIMTSDCLGLALNTTPNRSMSYLGAAMCIISMAQHAKPNVIGQIEL